MYRSFSVWIIMSALITAAAPLAIAQKQVEKGGPKHVFTGPSPKHLFDVILARPTDTSITASVLAYQDATVYLSYGTSSDKLSEKTPQKTLKADTPEELVLKGLQPDTAYYYRMYTRTGIEGEFTVQPLATFHTQRKAGSAFVFTVQSDSHLDQGTRPAVYERTLANALADKPDFHIDLGDTFMTDKYEKYKDALPQYIAQRYYFSRLASSAPLYLVAGNHDGERLDRDDGTAECMPVWSCLTRKKFFPNPFPDGFYTGNKTEHKRAGRLENYFAWTWGDALFVALDPFWTTGRMGKNKADGNWGRTLGKEQYDWLSKTLANSKAKYKFVFIHHLVGGLDDSGRGGSEAASLYEWGGKGKDNHDLFKEKRQGWEMPIHQLLVKHKVSVVFHGHDHFYAHQELDDVVYLMVPQPGQQAFDRVRNAEEYGYVRGEFLPPSGHIRVTVTGEKSSVEYVRAYVPQSESAQRKNGQVGHSFTIKP